MTAIEQAAAMVGGARKLLLTGHLKPDGDAVGSMVALAALLRGQGREATLYNPDLVPRHLKWLPHTKTLIHKLNPSSRYQLTIVVDCSDRAMLGDAFPPREVTGPLLVLDHHASGRPFGDLYVGDPKAASVGVLVARLANVLGWPIPADAAQGIYTSLVVDTGSFRYSNTNAEALRLAADLVEGGLVDPWTVSEQLHERSPLSRYRLLAAALQSLEMALGERVAFITITNEMVQKASAAWDDTEGIVNYTRAIEGVECGVLLTPARGGGVRVSMRSRGRAVDAGAVCLPFGGGGHPGAAGCKLPTEDLAEARRIVTEALAAALAAAAAAR